MNSLTGTPVRFLFHMKQARVAIVAARPFEYRGEPVAAGEVCLVQPAEAAALFYRQQARAPRADEAVGVYARRDMTAAAGRTRPRASRRQSARRDASTDPGE